MPQSNLGGAMRGVVALLVTTLALAGCGSTPASDGPDFSSSSSSTGGAVTSASSSSATSTSPAIESGQLVVTMIDVGQGMAVLVEFPDAVALIDIANRFSS